MVDMITTVERVRSFWDNFASGNLDACAATLAPDVLRIGPRQGVEADIIRGKEAYVAFLKDIKTTMPAHGGETHEVIATADGRRGYIHCKEIVALEAGSTNRVEVSVVMICHMNDDGLIAVLDIFWKQPAGNLNWTEARNLIGAAKEIG